MTSTILPIHAVTGLTALGWRKARRGETGDQPIWPIVGASEDDDQDDAAEGDDSGDQSDDKPDEDEVEPEGADQLGDAGKKALDAMKAKWRVERDKNKQTQAELDELRKAGKKDGEPSADDIRREAEQAAAQKANKRIVRSEIRAAAAGKLTDPKDALTFLDADQFEVDDNGEVDADEVADAIDELLQKKPYLAATAKRFQGTGDGGAARKAGKPKQLSRDDLKRMSPEEIAKAQEEGRLADLLAGKKKG